MLDATLEDLARQTLLGPFLRNLAGYEVEHVAHWQKASSTTTMF